MAQFTPHQLEALNTESHISLTANAGSGKTFVLKERYLQIALDFNIPLREIAAITYTEKAASELYKKIAELIDERISSTTSQFERTKLEDIRRQLISANISTIHSFCIHILREFPVEAGIDANFSPIDEVLANELLELSVDEIIRKKISTSASDSSIKKLIRIFDSASNVRKEIISLIKNRKNVIKLVDNLYSKTIDDVVLHFQKYYELFVNEILSPTYLEFLQNFKTVNDAAKVEGSEIAERIGLLIEDDLSALSIKNFLSKTNLYSEAFTNELKLKKIKYLRKERDNYTNEIVGVEKFFQLANQLKPDDNSFTSEKSLAELGFIFIELFNASLKAYENRKDNYAYLDFEDILIKTMEIISHEEVKKSLSSKFKFIMIDEYQDTNELQYNIFLPILNELRTGNLFVVGDEKQSIYRFRDAELEVFRKTNNDIRTVNEHGKILSLPDSFRMSPVICSFTNYLFAQLFANPNPIFNEVSPNEITCAKSEDLYGSVEFLFSINDEMIEEDETTSLSESELVARRILKLIKSNDSKEQLNLNDIAILCRKRKSFKELETTFKKYKIPFSIVGGTGFYQRQIVYDIYYYFSFLLNSRDDTALVAILRSPFFFLTDTEIFKISLSYGACFWDKFVNSVQGNNRYKQIVELLEENNHLANNTDIIFLLRKIISETGYISVLSSNEDGEQDLINFEKLIHITDSFFKQGFRNLFDYTAYLKQAINHYSDEGQAALIDDKNSVKIMTIHQSKGLEYKAVILFALQDYSETSTIKAKKIYVDKSLGILGKTPNPQNLFDDYISPPIVNVFNIINKRKNLAEAKRLFYVAITRAKNYLFLSADLNKKTNSESFFSFLKDVFPDLNNRSEIPLDTNLTFLKQVKGVFENKIETISQTIPIINFIDDESIHSTTFDSVPEKLIFNIDNIPSIISEEVISATKISIFSQCPVKYLLTYEYGFASLQRKIIERKSHKRNHSQSEIIEFVSDEEFRDDRHTDIAADLKGRIIHRIMEQNIAENELSIFISKFLEDEKVDVSESESYSDIILADLTKFYSSNIYKHLSSYNNYFNEYELYAKVNDFFLYGIIDRLIITDEKIIIIDFKTDDFLPKEIDEKVKTYIPQLTFYAFLISIKFNLIKDFELHLVFTKHPELSFNKVLSIDEINVFRNQLLIIVDKIRTKKFNPNYSHCKNCLYSIDKKNCVMKND
jgi:ATP-dependent helicase/nuclease subunit A